MEKPKPNEPVLMWDGEEGKEPKMQVVWRQYYTYPDGESDDYFPSQIDGPEYRYWILYV